MKLKLFRIPSACVAAVALLGAGSILDVNAAAPDLLGQVVLRPLTPTEKTTYGLASLQGASGLSAVGVGQPAYLEALVNIAIPPSDIVGVTWALTKQPLGSTAALTTSPLGANVPTFKMADREDYQVAGRTFLRPDLAGQYTITATITTTSSGTTNLTRNISAATYMGSQVCELCHSGGAIADSIYPKWSNTLHATKFTRSIDGKVGSYSKNCISCHTVGYDVNTNAVNGGFDDIATQVGWTFPTNLTNGNWAAMPSTLQSVANIGCENCHGPGSEHAYAFGNTNLANWPRIGKSLSAGNCGQCHDSMTHHFKNGEWNNSRHAVTTRDPTGPGEESCVRCHTGLGYVAYINGVAKPPTDYEAITCATCHEPHDATNPHQLRTNPSITLMDKKTTITMAQAGNGIICMNCHISRRDATNYVETTSGSSRFGPHHGPQTDMLLGANAVTYGKDIPSSAHRDVVKDTCVTCHMQEVTSGPAFTRAGGHTFRVGAEASGTNAAVDLVEACQQCHGPIEDFDFARQDFDGNGVVEGVQTEVKGLLNKLGLLLPPVGVAKPISNSIGISSSWTKPQLKAGYNYLFVVEDGSYGIHNLAYTVGILKASIIDLNGDLNNDGIPDKWQIQYFGSANSTNAAPTACPAGDGISNWAKYALGLDPTVKGTPVEGGVVWANGSNLYTSSSTNAIKIYTAAEVAFNTELGKNYQIQGISQVVGAAWQNIGEPVAGTGKTTSYVTPSRQNVQQYFRVITLP